MATQRYISTSFWDDEWIQTLDPSEKLLYLYLMTNPLTNIAGVYKITDRRISFDTGFNLDTIRHIFAKFEKAGKVFRKDEYVVIPSWPKHQKWDKSSKVNEGIIRILRELEAEMITFLTQIHYRYPIDTLSIPPAYPSNYSYSDFNSDLDSDSSGGVLSGADETSPPDEPVVISIPRLGGTEFPITENHVKTFSDAYPAVDVVSELRKMKAWIIANRSRQKKDILRFANNWLSRAQDDSVKVPRGNQNDKPSQRTLGNKERWDAYFAEEDAKHAK